MKKALICIFAAGLLLASGCGQTSGTDTVAPQQAEASAAEALTPANGLTASSIASPGPETEEPDDSAANALWRDATEEEAGALIPRLFQAPEGAEKIQWRVLDQKSQSENDEDAEDVGPLVELTFTLNGLDFSARAQTNSDETADISEMYYDWTDEKAVTLANWGQGHMAGMLLRSADGAKTAELCTWYDIEIGTAYSLSVVASDLKGFDLQAVAESMYNPDAEPIMEE